MGDLRDLEEEIATDRVALSKSLDALTSTLAPENLRTHAATLVETYGNDISRQAWSAACKNPAGFALVGAGIALLISGTGTRPNIAVRAETDTIPQPDEAMVGFDARVAAADAAMSKDYEGNEIMTQPDAKSLRSRIEDGLDALPPKARLRVREARQAAVTAQEKVEDQARRAARQSSAALQSQPLAVGAVALGIGALIGALLPSSRREDELMGEHRDRVMARAQGVLNEEMDKLHTSVKAKVSGDSTPTYSSH